MPVAFLQTLLLFFVFSIPGYLMWKCLRPASASVITLIAVSFTTGYLVLTWLLYFLSLSFNLGFSAGNFLILSAAATLIFAFIARAGRDSCFPSLRPVPSWEVAAFIAALFVGFVYYQNYSINQILDTFCLKDNIRLLIEPPSEPAYLLRHIVGDQREGGPAFSAGWIAFFPGNTAGFRMVYAFCGFSIAFFTFLALRAALRKDALAFAVMLLASLHPYLFRIRGIDENLISLSVSTFLIWLLLRRESCLSPLIGFAAAYLFNIRHENIP
ncbi:MAG: hypothetical protein FJ088_10205, partial [Deltaproteobacteria bacterium]|nr:hypothetical protein [Deltaproteobacteria bacterium]